MQRANEISDKIQQLDLHSPSHFKNVDGSRSTPSKQIQGNAKPYQINTVSSEPRGNRQLDWPYAGQNSNLENGGSSSLERIPQLYAGSSNLLMDQQMISNLNGHSALGGRKHSDIMYHQHQQPMSYH